MAAATSNKLVERTGAALTAVAAEVVEAPLLKSDVRVTGAAGVGAAAFALGAIEKSEVSDAVVVAGAVMGAGASSGIAAVGERAPLLVRLPTPPPATRPDTAEDTDEAALGVRWWPAPSAPRGGVEAAVAAGAIDDRARSNSEAVAGATGGAMGGAEESGGENTSSSD